MDNYINYVSGIGKSESSGMQIITEEESVLPEFTLVSIYTRG